MVDIFKLYEDFKNYNKFQTKYKNSKFQTHEFYMSHIYEIDTSIDDYYESSDDKDKCEEIFKANPVLKTYLSLETIKNHYKEERNKYKISPELEKLGKSVMCLYQNSFSLYDLDNNIIYNFEIDNKNIIKYIEYGLTKCNKFIAYINENELNVIKVINQDIINDSKLSQLDDKEICNRMFNELVRARMFDDSYIYFTDTNQIVNRDDEYKRILDDYRNNKIDKKEYYIRFYYCLILCEQNITKLYLEADNEHKEYIIDAYLLLSEYHYNNNKVRIRSTSAVINEAVLNRRKKTDAK